ncbi:MAG: DNA polymerase Y family protein [Planctomycetota bacterium]
MAIRLTGWPIDRFRRRERQRGSPDDRPTLLIDRQGQRRTVAACCSRAARAGAAPGMPAAEARALFPPGAVRLAPADAPGDRRALRRLAVWALRLSPLVEPQEPDGLLLDVTGCARAFGGERALAERAVDGIGSLGIGARVAVAPTFTAAGALARGSGARLSIIGPSELGPALEPLPLGALGLADADLAPLASLGIERIGQLLDLPRAALPARFGAGVLLALDRALGHAMESILPIEDPEPVRAHRTLEGPTDRVEAVEGIVREQLASIASRLAERESGVRSLRVDLARSDLPPETLTVTVGRPTRDARHLWRLLAPKLERAHLGFGVEAVTTEVTAAVRLAHEQCVHLPSGSADAATDLDADRAASECIDTLANRLGPGRVLRPVMVPSHRPERSVALHDAAESPPPASSASPSTGGVQATPSDRPTVLFDRPEPADVVALTPDGPVHAVRFRGEDHAVIACIGPERIGSEWWRGRGSTRDYFRVQTESGVWLWLARSIEPGGWRVHGVWA